MTLTTFAWIFFVVYIAALVYFGWAGQRKTKTLTDFVAAKRSYVWYWLSLATMAQWCSAAAFMGQPGLGYNIGFPALWYVIGYIFSGFAWALSIYGMWQAGARTGARSTPNYLGIRFNSKAVQLIAALITLMMIFYVAAQFVGIGWVFMVALKIPSYLIGCIIAAFITAGYICAGGTHSDILTDALQGAVMVIVALIALFTAFLLVVKGGPAGVNASITAQNAAIGWHNTFSSFAPAFMPWAAVSICVALGFGALSPQMSKNFLALKKASDIKKMAIFASVLMIIMSFMMLAGIGIRALYGTHPELGPVLAKAPDQAIIQFFTREFPPILGAFLVVGILCAIMSTADGLYLVISTAITTDIYRDLIAPRLHKDTPAEVLDRRVLIINRLMILVIAVVSLWIAIPPPKFLTVLLWTGLGGFTVAISPSLILGALFRRTTRVATLASMIGSIAVYVYLITLGGMHPFPAIGYGLMVSLGLHLIVNPFTKPEPEEHLNRIFGKISPK
jgi:Na+/proline symporter